MTALKIAGAALAAALAASSVSAAPAAPSAAAPASLDRAALAALHASVPAGARDRDAADRPRARSLRLAQTYSSKCVTPTTICFVDPAPVNNPCSCGSSQGRIQR